MSTSLFTAEEKRQVRWFVMRAYKNKKMAEDRLKDKEYGLEYFIPKHYAVRTCLLYTSPSPRDTR